MSWCWVCTGGGRAPPSFSYLDNCINLSAMCGLSGSKEAARL